MTGTLDCHIDSLTDAIEAWEILWQGMFEGSRKEGRIAGALALRLIESRDLRDVIGEHVRFRRLPLSTPQSVRVLAMVRNQLRLDRRMLADLVQSDVEAALFLVRHPHLVDVLLDAQWRVCCPREMPLTGSLQLPTTEQWQDFRHQQCHRHQILEDLTEAVAMRKVSLVGPTGERLKARDVVFLRFTICESWNALSQRMCREGFSIIPKDPLAAPRQVTTTALIEIYRSSVRKRLRTVCREKMHELCVGDDWINGVAPRLTGVPILFPPLRFARETVH